MQIYQMDAMNFHFVAHPNAWVVHRPHAPSSGYNHTFTGEAYTLKHKPTDHLWKMERIAKVSLLLSLHPDWLLSRNKCNQDTNSCCSSYRSGNL